MEYFEKIKKWLSTWGIVLAASAVCSVVTYLITDSMSQSRIEKLQSQIAELEKKEKEALVTKRISQQMEEIAYQQKTVSDKQRERAEEQSRIADMERGKALIERGLAQVAERKAISAAAQADSMRALAENQSVIALNNMLAAEKARAQADTLFYVSLGRSLAQTSLTKNGTEGSDLSRLLAYASWYYTKKYGGDVMQQDVYHSIVRASGSMVLDGGGFNGNVRVVKNISIKGQHTLLAVTDYGEIILWQGDDHRLFNPDNSNYRDAVIEAQSNMAYLLSNKGELRVIDYSSAFSGAGNNGVRILRQLQLPNDVWKKLIHSGTDKLIAVGENTIAWVDINATKVLNTVNVPNISTAGMSDNTLHVYTSDSHHYYSNAPGEVIPRDFNLLKGKVSDYYFSNAERFHILGMDDGTIYVIDSNGRILKELTGHTSAITKVELFNNVLVSTSYDHTLRFWQMNYSSSVIASFVQTLDRWPLTFDMDREGMVLWTGTQDGYLSHFCVDIEQNANDVRSLLNREFTPDEWDYYVGPQIPQQYFLKGGGR